MSPDLKRRATVCWLTPRLPMTAALLLLLQAWVLVNVACNCFSQHAVGLANNSCAAPKRCGLLPDTHGTHAIHW